MTENLERRLVRLERQNHWLRCSFAIIVWGALALLLMGQSGSSVVSAKSFQLSDGGKVRAELTLIGGEPSLLLRDKAGKNRFAVTLQQGNPKLVLYDGKAKARFMVTTQRDGSPAVVLYDGNNRGRTTIALRPDGSPIVVFTKADGSLQRSLP